MQHDRSPFREYCGLTAVSWPSPQVPSGDHSMREPASVKPCNGSRPSTVRCSSPEYQPRLRRRPLTSVMLCMLCVLCVWSTLNQNRPPYTAGHPCKGRGIPTQGTSRVVGSHSRYKPISTEVRAITCRLLSITEFIACHHSLSACTPWRYRRSMLSAQVPP